MQRCRRCVGTDPFPIPGIRRVRACAPSGVATASTIVPAGCSKFGSGRTGDRNADVGGQHPANSARHRQCSLFADDSELVEDPAVDPEDANLGFGRIRHHRTAHDLR